MEYQKIANSLDNASDHPSIFRTKNPVEENDESREGYTTARDIKFKYKVYVIMLMHTYLLREQ